MKRCWVESGDARPTFEELVESTSGILHDARQSVKRKNETSETSSMSKFSNPYQNDVQETKEHKYVVLVMAAA